MDLDRLGIWSSVLCILHCLLTPLLVLTVPFLGNFLSESWIHILIALIVFPVAVMALWRGYRLHQIKSTLYLGLVGLLFVVLAFTSGWYSGEMHRKVEVVMMILGGTFLTFAHYFNLRFCRTHAHDHSHGHGHGHGSHQHHH
jgi:hypothetical protein